MGARLAPAPKRPRFPPRQLRGHGPKPAPISNPVRAAMRVADQRHRASHRVGIRPADEQNASSSTIRPPDQPAISRQTPARWEPKRALGPRESPSRLPSRGASHGARMTDIRSGTSMTPASRAKRQRDAFGSGASTRGLRLTSHGPPGPTARAGRRVRSRRLSKVCNQRRGDDPALPRGRRRPIRGARKRTSSKARCWPGRTGLAVVPDRLAPRSARCHAR